MKRIFFVIILLLTLSLFQTTFLCAETDDLPLWVDELQSCVGQVLHSRVETSRVNERDFIEGKRYSVIRMQGRGSLKKVSDPFEAVRRLFSATNGWIEDLRYLADGHGSSSFAFRKKLCFCIVSIWIDSSCNDEETGHVPGKFWFSIDCRKSAVSLKGRPG